MTTALPATNRSGNATSTLQTHRSPRIKSFAARPEVATTATISPAAQAALAAATVPPDASTSTAAPAGTEARPASAQKASVQNAYRPSAG